MASRQFSLVVFRALAVYVFSRALTLLWSLLSMWLTNPVIAGEQMYTIGHKVGMSFVWAVNVLLAAFLWTGAEKFAGIVGDAQPTLRAGNWVVRLVFTALGIAICTFSIDSFVTAVANVISPDPIYSERKRDTIIAAVIEGIRFFIGLGIILAYRFDKAAVIQAAEAIEEKTSV